MVRLTDNLTMTIAVDWNVKPQTKQKKTFVEIVHSLPMIPVRQLSLTDKQIHRIYVQ